MGSRSVAPHAIISTPHAGPSNGDHPSTVALPGRRFRKTKTKTPNAATNGHDAGTRWPMSVLAAMLSTARQLLSRGAAPQPPPDLSREAWLPAEPASGAAARSMVADAAADVGLGGERAWDLMVATSEAFANAVQHGKPWPNQCILLRTEPCAQGLRVEVTDCGTFDSQLEPAALDATSGRGVQIIAAIVDRLEVQNGNGRTLVRFEKHTDAT
jgi:serine/threonine-protein kinase RsbW